MEDDNVGAARTFIDSLTDTDDAADKLQGLEALFNEVEGEGSQ